MRLALINPLFAAPLGSNKPWITVPPQGYGGIQWVVATLSRALLERGHEVTLYGAPGSEQHLSLCVSASTNPHSIAKELAAGDYEIIHDFSLGLMSLPEFEPRCPRLATYSLTGKPQQERNVVFLSYAQRKAAGVSEAPVIRLPVDPRFLRFRETKGNYLLFLGRISPWKGALEAAGFAANCGVRLKLAGPVWESEYFELIMKRYGHAVEYVGEVGGEERLRLLSEARALLVMSQPVMGPWGSLWSEPGATVVSEAAACGTPVISTDNGCLSEIAPHVGVVVPTGIGGTHGAGEILRALPAPSAVYATAIEKWNSSKIAREYELVYRKLRDGEHWPK
jgi:glycosyltransferase involved in cell wall biosynthesis